MLRVLVSAEEKASNNYKGEVMRQAQCTDDEKPIADKALDEDEPGA